MHFAFLLLQMRKSMVRVQLVQHVPVDVEEVAAIGALPDQMKIPDLVEQGPRHEIILVADDLRHTDLRQSGRHHEGLRYLGRPGGSRQAA